MISDHLMKAISPDIHGNTNKILLVIYIIAIYIIAWKFDFVGHTIKSFTKNSLSFFPSVKHLCPLLLKKKKKATNPNFANKQKM